MSDEHNPERIYLEPYPGSDVYGAGRMWCEDQVDDDWVEYIRADLAPTPESEGEGDDLAKRLEVMAAWMAGVVQRPPSPDDPEAFPCHITKLNAETVAEAARRLRKQGGGDA